MEVYIFELSATYVHHSDPKYMWEFSKQILKNMELARHIDKNTDPELKNTEC